MSRSRRTLFRQDSKFSNKEARQRLKGAISPCRQHEKPENLLKAAIWQAIVSRWHQMRHDCSGGPDAGGVERNGHNNHAVLHRLLRLSRSLHLARHLSICSSPSSFARSLSNQTPRAGPGNKWTHFAEKLSWYLPWPLLIDSRRICLLVSFCSIHILFVRRPVSQSVFLSRCMTSRRLPPTSFTAICQSSWSTSSLDTTSVCPQGCFSAEWAIIFFNLNYTRAHQIVSRNKNHHFLPIGDLPPVSLALCLFVSRNRHWIDFMCNFALI